MLKIVYESEQFYTEHYLNDPSTTKLEVVFDDDASYTEIIAKIMQVLEFMTYPKPSKKSWEEMTETLICDGRIIREVDENE